MAASSTLLEHSPTQAAGRARMAVPARDVERPRSYRERVCCWCQPERATWFEESQAPGIRFGICSDCLEARLHEIRGRRPSRSRASTRIDERSDTFLTRS